MKNRVTVPHEYFKKARREYKDYRFAWPREVIQNAVDAKATEIRIICDFTPNNPGSEIGTIVLCCTDNGTGMTQDVMLNKFLCLGGSLKEEGATGGFGYAKTLILLSWQEYTVKTIRDGFQTKVNGKGGEYDYTVTATTERNGTSIIVSEQGSRADQIEWLKRVNQYAGLTTLLGVTISVHDGLSKEVVRYSENKQSPEMKRVRGIEGAKMYRLPREGSDYTIGYIYKNGLPMWAHSTYNPGNKNYIFTYEPEGASTDLFTANRDGFRDAPHLQFMVAMKRLQDATKSTDSEGEQPLLGFNMDPTARSTRSTGLSGETAKLFDTIHTKVRINAYPKDLLLWCDDLNSKGNSGYSARDISRVMQDANVCAMAYVWKASINMVLDSVIGMKMCPGLTKDDTFFYINGQPIYGGFVFATHAEAISKSAGESHLLAVNPALIANNDADDSWGDDGWYAQDVLDLAIHEICHLWQQNHGEAFSVLEGTLRRYLRRKVWTDEQEKILEQAFQEGRKAYRSAK